MRIALTNRHIQMRIALTNRHIQVIKEEILGSDYSLSLAYISPKKSQELNKKYRKKNKPTNVLSFSLRENEGELLLCKSIIAQEAKSVGRTPREWLGFLVIHGMLHLKGFEHSSKMEELENRYDKKYFYRNRRGLAEHPRRSGRIHKRRKSP